MRLWYWFMEKVSDYRILQTLAMNSNIYNIGDNFTDVRMLIPMDESTIALNLKVRQESVRRGLRRLERRNKVRKASGRTWRLPQVSSAAVSIDYFWKDDRGVIKGVSHGIQS